MDLSVGAVGAAFIAGIVSILGLVIGKEQKVSEFRQAWIDELRKCFASYLVHINAIVDLIRQQKPGDAEINPLLVASYKALNEASHGITLRVNEAEKPAKALLKAMDEFQEIAGSKQTLTVERVREAEKKFLKAAKKLLKFEWRRVKRGEATFVWTKRAVFIITLAMLGLLIYFMFFGAPSIKRPVVM